MRITVVTDDRAVVGDLEGTPIDCRRVMTLRGMRAWTVARQIARFERPLVVHVWGTACWRSLGERALRFGLPVVVHALSMRDVERLAQRHLPPGVRVAVASGPLLNAYLERAGEHAARAVAIPLAFLMPDAPADELETLPENMMSVVWSGQITAQAGLNTLIDAVAQLREKGHELQLALIGAGPADRHVWEHMRRANVIDCVSLVYDARLWDQSMRGVHVCVVPARQCELSLAPLLAMVYGRVVISSRDQIAEWFVKM